MVGTAIDGMSLPALLRLHCNWNLARHVRIPFQEDWIPKVPVQVRTGHVRQSSSHTRSQMSTTKCSYFWGLQNANINDCQCLSHSQTLPTSSHIYSYLLDSMSKRISLQFVHKGLQTTTSHLPAISAHMRWQWSVNAPKRPQAQQWWFGQATSLLLRVTDIWVYLSGLRSRQADLWLIRTSIRRCSKPT